ncbi:MAG: hypothetical protein ACNFW9_00685 [Candidatus Kerfeldbacteria bacterium]
MPKGESIQPSDSDGVINSCSVCGLSLDSGDHSECQQDNIEQANNAKVELTEEQQEKVKLMIKYLSNGYISNVIKIKKEYFLPDEVMQSPEVQAAAKEGMIKKLSRGYFGDAVNTKDELTLPDDFMQSPEVQAAVKEGMIEDLSKGHVIGAIKIKKEYFLPDDFMQSPEVQAAVKEGMIKELSKGYIDKAIEIKDKFCIPDDFMQSPEVQAAAKEGMIKELVSKNTDWYNLNNKRVFKIKEEFSLPDEVMQSPEVQDEAKEAMIRRLSNSNIDEAIEIKDKFPIPEVEAINIAKEVMIEYLSEGYIDRAIEIKDKFSLPDEVIQSPEVQAAAKEVMIKILFEGNIDLAIKIKDKLSIPEVEVIKIAKAAMIKRLSNGYIDSAIKIKDKLSIPEVEAQKIFSTYIKQYLVEGRLNLVLSNLDRFPENSLKSLEAEYHLLGYRDDLNLQSEEIYIQYIRLKDNKDEIQVVGFVEQIRDSINSLISSGEQGPEITEMENYKALIKVTYPNHANNWTDYDSNESCTDCSADLEQFKVRDKYTVDLTKGVEMVLRLEQAKDEKALANLEKPIAGIQKKFSEHGFEKAKMLEVLDSEIEGRIIELPNKEIYKTREEKLYGLLLESLVGKFNSEDLKELLIGYQFAEFEDIKTYLEDTRAQAELAKNPDYAYLLELREFFADHIKEVERKIASDAVNNPEIAKILPEYYQQKRNLDSEQSRKDNIDRLQINKIGLGGNLLDRISKELSKKTDKRGNIFSLGTRDDDGNLVPGKKTNALAGIINAELNKVGKAIRFLTGQEVDPKSIHLGELNFVEYLQSQEMIQDGEYDEELFSRYLLQAFQGIFEKELTIIDREVSKYAPKEEELKGKKAKKLECFIMKNHTSAHARGVGGVCVSGDNPAHGEENQWDMPNYFQMVLRDSESKICQGAVLLHYYEDKGKKILTGSFNPSSTYLYQVDEQQLFKGLLKQLEVFAQDNDIDVIAVNQNKTMRTNRTGGEFERAMSNKIKSVNKTESLSQEEVFSYHPKYSQKGLDIVWEKE